MRKPLENTPIPRKVLEMLKKIELNDENPWKV